MLVILFEFNSIESKVVQHLASFPKYLAPSSPIKFSLAQNLVSVVELKIDYTNEQIPLSVIRLVLKLNSLI